MKILHITLDFGDGGAEKLIVELSNEMSNTNMVYVCSLWDLRKEDYFHHFFNEKIEFISLRKKKGFDFSIPIKLYRLLSKIKPEVVNTHRSAINYISLITPLFPSINFFHTVHNDAFKESQNRLGYYFRKISFKNNLIKPITISEESNISFKNLYKLRATLIYNGVKQPTKSDSFNDVLLEIESLKNNKETKVFVNIARLSNQKNHKMLVKVFNKLILDGNNVLLLIVGKIDQKIYDQLEPYVREGIYFLGSKVNATDYLRHSDAFCLSSIYEGMPISLIESFAMSCIPICTPVGGIRDMITDSYNGFLSKDISETEYSKTVTRLLTTPKEMLKIMKQNGKKEYNDKYNIELTTDNYLKLYMDE